MLRTASRWSLLLGASALTVFGAVSFLAPGWASDNFPWKVGPFLAMTIGGWSLGTAAIAWDAARDLRPSSVYPLLVFLGSFAVAELMVALLFVDRLRLTGPLTIPYLVGLGALLVAFAGSIGDWAVRRPELRGAPGHIPRWMSVWVAAFVLLVGFLSAANWIAGPDGTVARGDFFPEPMGLFSIRAFAGFFLALTLSALSLVAARALPPWERLGRAGLYLIVPITLAGFVNVALFDFTGRPGTFAYLAAYVVVGIGLAIYLFGGTRGHVTDETKAPAAT